MWSAANNNHCTHPVFNYHYHTSDEHARRKLLRKKPVDVWQKAFLQSLTKEEDKEWSLSKKVGSGKRTCKSMLWKGSYFSQWSIICSLKQQLTDGFRIWQISCFILSATFGPVWSLLFLFFLREPKQTSSTFAAHLSQLIVKTDI